MTKKSFKLFPKKSSDLPTSGFAKHPCIVIDKNKTSAQPGRFADIISSKRSISLFILGNLSHLINQRKPTNLSSMG